MKLYFQIKATVPTTIRGGVRKIEIEIMPDYMSFIDSVCDKDNGMVLITNEQGYQQGYDEATAKELLLELYSKAISLDYIMFFEKTKSGFVKQIGSVIF